MVWRKLVVVGVVGLALSACAPPAAPPVDAAAEEQAIRAISARWLELERAKDADGILAMFADDATVAWAGMEPASGKAAIQAVMQKAWAEAPNAAIGWSTDRVMISAAGDMAAETGSWTATGVGPDGKGEDQGRYLTVYRKVDGTWKVAADTSGSSKQ